MWSKIALYDKLHMTKLFVVWSNFVMWINDKLLLVPNIAANLQCMLFYSGLRWFDEKSILLRYTQFCVEQKNKPKNLVRGAK